jgi:glutamate 5-kinase
MKGLHRIYIGFAGGRQVATLVRADWLVLLTDVDGLFTANPATDPAAQPIHEVADLAALHVRARPPPGCGVRG